MVTLPPKKPAGCGASELALHASDVKGGGSARSKGSSGEEDASERFLNATVFNEALEGFNKYDPEAWMPTISVHISDFIRLPWQLVTGFTLAATVLVKMVPVLEPLFSLSSDL